MLLYFEECVAVKQINLLQFESHLIIATFYLACFSQSGQPPRLCKNNNSKITCESAIGQHLLTNPECAKTYTDDNFRIIGQGRSSFHLGVLESVYIKTQNPVLCKQKDFIFSLGIFK